MGKKMTKADLAKRGVEYRFAYSKGYEDGFKRGLDAIGIKEFVATIMMLGDPKTVKKVMDWAEKEHAKAKENAQFGLPNWVKGGICRKPAEVMCNLGFACDGCPFNHDRAEYGTIIYRTFTRHHIEERIGRKLSQSEWETLQGYLVGPDAGMEDEIIGFINTAVELMIQDKKKKRRGKK